jgi:hypothetical protein
MAINVVVVGVELSPIECLYPSFYIQGGEVIRKVTESVTTWSQLKLYLYFLFYIYFHRYNFLCLGSTLWSSRIFWMVGRIEADLSLGLPGPCEMIPWVLILVNDIPPFFRLRPYGWKRKRNRKTNLEGQEGVVELTRSRLSSSSFSIAESSWPASVVTQEHLQNLVS